MCLNINWTKSYDIRNKKISCHVFRMCIFSTIFGDFISHKVRYNACEKIISCFELFTGRFFEYTFVIFLTAQSLFQAWCFQKYWSAIARDSNIKWFKVEKSKRNVSLMSISKLKCHYSHVHISWNRLFYAWNQDSHQNFDPSLLNWYPWGWSKKILLAQKKNGRLKKLISLPIPNFFLGFVLG